MRINQSGKISQELKMLLQRKKRDKSRVAILGMGLGGLEAFKHLKGFLDIELTCIDKNDFHLFTPLLYQVALGQLSKDEVTLPLPPLFKGTCHRFIKDEVLEVSLSKKTLRLKHHSTIRFDYIIFALGSKANDFKSSTLDSASTPLKTIDDAIAIKKRIAKIRSQQKRPIDINIVGGGPTGVELSAGLADSLSDNACIKLINSADRVLAAYDDKLSDYAEKTLQDSGVDLLNKQNISEGESQDFPFHKKNTLFIRAIGVGPQTSIIQEIKTEGYLAVRKDLSIKGFPFAFSCGDQIHINEVPKLAPAAMQTGRKAAKNICRLIKEKPTREFRYYNKGQLAVISPGQAVGEVFGVPLKGPKAWAMWGVIHLGMLPGTEQKAHTFIKWSKYFLYKKASP